VFNPHERINVDEALEHPYFKSLHNAKSEHSCSRAFDFEFEKLHMTKEVLQEFMWQEIQHYRPELKGKTWVVDPEKRAAQIAAAQAAKAAAAAAAAQQQQAAQQQ